MEIRRATAADLPAILDIYNDAVLTTTATYDYEVRSLEAQQRWFEEHDRDGLAVYVAEAPDGEVVAWSSLSHFHARPGYRFTLENSVYVSAGERGKGIGSLLIPPLIQAAKDSGAHAIIAAIDADSAASLRLHARFGFEQVGHLKEVGYKFERWLDVIYMQLLI